MTYQSVKVCGKCGKAFEGQEGISHLGHILCEDCYIDGVTIVKTCDPWAVYVAGRTDTKGEGLTALQSKIIGAIRQHASPTLEQLCYELAVSEEEFRSSFAVLRHMGLAHARKTDGQIEFLLVDKPSAVSN